MFTEIKQMGYSVGYTNQHKCLTIYRNNVNKLLFSGRKQTDYLTVYRNTTKLFD